MEVSVRSPACELKNVLFLCSGNYYRSRFAEIVFNHLARERGLPWRADSRGLVVGRAGNVGAISRYALEGLQARELATGADERFPLQVTAADLKSAHLIVAVKEAEHRPMLTQLYPEWIDRVEFWHVHDLDCAEACDALAELELHLQSLADRLAGSGS